MRTEEKSEKVGEKRDWGRLSAISLTVALWGVGVYLIFRYAIGILLPFLLAFAVAAAIRPLASRLSGKLHLNYRFCAFTLTLLLLVLAVCFSLPDVTVSSRNVPAFSNGSAGNRAAGRTWWHASGTGSRDWGNGFR